MGLGKKVNRWYTRAYIKQNLHGNLHTETNSNQKLKCLWATKHETLYNTYSKTNKMMRTKVEVTLKQSIIFPDCLHQQTYLDLQCGISVKTRPLQIIKFTGVPIQKPCIGSNTRNLWNTDTSRGPHIRTRGHGGDMEGDTAGSTCNF